MDPIRKDDIFRLPEMNNLHFGRNISTAQLDDYTFSTMQTGSGRQTAVLLCRFDKDGHRTCIKGPEGTVYQPSLAAGGDRLHVVWNEFSAGHWRLCHASLDKEADALSEHEVIHQSSSLCQPPVVIVHDHSPCCAFAALAKGGSEIHIGRRHSDGWVVTTPFADGRGDCHRPSLASGNDGLYVIWDQYREKNYQVMLGVLQEERAEVLEALRGKGQRWLKPKVTATSDGTIYLCWLVLQAVIDKLGIIDHHPYIMAARRRNGKLTYLTDDENRENPCNIGDLREGLLAGEIYKGHVGLRRNPQLALDQREKLWLWWEMRPETRGSDVIGHLVGRKMTAPGCWSNPAVYCRNGYCYAVPPRFSNPTPATVYYHFESKDFDLIRSEKIKLGGGDELIVNNDKWRRWKNISLTPPVKPAATVKLRGEEYKMVWADTHCHSNFSPDAEGELDEIINFAKDTAGLDAISVIDNDYYPHKALTEAEWQTQGQLAEHFTKDNQFVWLPGYEFTYHRSDLQPDFNHRCVIYPRRGGKLLRRIDPEARTDQKMIAELKQGGGMAYPHHCSYQLIDTSVEWNVEVCSSWRICLEETAFTMNQLQAGARIGFIGSSDTHRAVPGMGGARTGLYVKELTPDALFEAYRKRRVIATQGFNIFIDFRIDKAFIGEQTVAGTAPLIRGTIKEAPERIDYVELIRDGEIIWWDNPATAEYEFSYQDRQVEAGRHFYFLKVKLHGDPSLNVNTDPAGNFPRPFEQNSRYPHNLARARGVFAWTSPIWLTIG